MSQSLFLPNRPVPVVDWDRFKSLPSERAPLPALDVAAINARLAPWRGTPVRILRGTFRVPVDASPEAVRRVAAEKTKTFIKVKEAEGWALVGRPEIAVSRFERTLEMDGSGGQAGMVEMVVRARFRKLDFAPVRIDVGEYL